MNPTRQRPIDDDLFEQEMQRKGREMEMKFREVTRQAEMAAMEQQVKDACVQAGRLAAQRLRNSPDLPLTEDELILSAIDGVLLARELEQDQQMTPGQALAAASSAPRAQARERLLGESWGRVPEATNTLPARL